MNSLRKHLLSSRAARLLLAAVFCALVLDGIAFIVHSHAGESGAGSAAAHADQCGYCATYHGLNSATTEPAIPPALAVVTLLALFAFISAPASRRPATLAQPRAPPRS
ncbi:MAG TPA: DUF2946 family protein [Steroidobacteraceae bacterium]|nr:DUF2946 family protein [Steroidobacteraceae bacterium]